MIEGPDLLASDGVVEKDTSIETRNCKTLKLRREEDWSYLLSLVFEASFLDQFRNVVACLDLPHYHISFDISCHQEILSWAIWTNTADSMRMTMIGVCEGTCVDIDQDQFSISQAAKADGVAESNQL